MKSRLCDSWNLLSLKSSAFSHIQVHIWYKMMIQHDTTWYKIQVLSLMTSLFKKGSLSWNQWKTKSHIKTRFIKSVSVNNCGIQISHRFTYPILVRSIFFLEMLMASTISCTLYCGFSASGFSPWQSPLLGSYCNLHLSKLPNFKSLKAIVDDCKL